MTETLLSIVTINLNHRDGLQRTRDSVLTHIGPDMEWMVVDGGSTDGSVDLLRAEDHPSTRWISEPDSGVYEAMNKGWKLAKGNFVLFLNSGDVLADGEVLGKMRERLRDGRADLYYGDAFRRNSRQEWVEVRYPDPLNLSQFYSGGLCHQTEFFRRQVLERFSGYDETYRIGGDWELLVRMLLAGVATEHVPFPIVYYEGGGLSQKQVELRETEKLRMYAESVPPAVDRDMRNLMLAREENHRLRELDQWVKQVRSRNVLVNMTMVLKWSLQKARKPREALK
ncbi:MAG: glycosyltransferase [Verrucomicrobia bacterium]|nr:glycosyltransferase [Verrucomicrobiota bacterium]